MNFLLTAVAAAVTLMVSYHHMTAVGAEKVHDMFELSQGCSNLWQDNMTASFKRWHDECEISTNIKITDEATMEHILPVYGCILMDVGVYILSTGMPIVDAIKMNLALDIKAEDDWRYGIIDDVFTLCVTKDKMSEIMYMSVEEFVEHNQCYWKVIDQRCHADTHQKI